jgi:transcriptional regulator with XRE-family HTH domain
MGKRPKGELELYKFIGQQIKKARLANEPARMDGQKNPSAMTQTILANAIGVTFQQVQKYEKGVNRVPIDKLLAIGIKTKKEDINYFLPHDILEETEITMKIP